MQNQNLVSEIMWMVDEQAEAVVTEEKGFINVTFSNDYRREFYYYIILIWLRLNQQRVQPIAVTRFGRIRKIKIPCL